MAVEAAVSGETTKVVRIRITETRRNEPYSSGQRPISPIPGAFCSHP